MVRTGLETAISFAADALLNLDGPMGMILSEAITVVGGELLHFVAAGAGAFKRGDWVILNLGLRSKIINQIPKVVEGFIGGLPDELDYLPEDLGSSSNRLRRAKYLCSHLRTVGNTN